MLAKEPHCVPTAAVSNTVTPCSFGSVPVQVKPLSPCFTHVTAALSSLKAKSCMDAGSVSLNVKPAASAVPVFFMPIAKLRYPPCTTVAAPTDFVIVSLGATDEALELLSAGIELELELSLRA